MKKLYFLLAVLLISNISTAQVVISQAYGGGGNAGSTFTHDYVELLNTGTTSVSLNGMSIQYASATGTTWAVTALPNVSLLPGQYFLIQQAQGAGGTTPLPTPDLIPTTPIAMSGTNFKILLANTVDAQTGCPTGTQIIDFVGFGSANCFEGTVAGVLSNTTAGLRANNGCQDTNNNSSDFTAGTPNPRNTSSPVNICGTASANDNAIAALKIYPNPNTGSTLYVTSDLIGDKSVVVFDVLGKQILKVTNVTENGINIGNLKAGIYMVKVSQDGKSATRKLVVQ
jgi:predicted extracellular nuclease